MKLLFQLLRLSALCSPVFCAVFEPETAKGTRKEPVKEATVDADAGVSFSKDRPVEKSELNADSGVKVVEDSSADEKGAESDEGAEGDEGEEDGEEDEEEEVSQVPLQETLTCTVTADETVQTVTYFYADLTSTVSPADYVSQWSIPKTFSVTLQFAQPAFLSVITSTNNQNVLCSAFAIYCTVQDAANHAVPFPLTNSVQQWLTTPLSTAPSCISNPGYGMTGGECVGGGTNWINSSTSACPTSDRTQGSAFGIPGLSGTAQMGAAAPYGAFRWPLPLVSIIPSPNSVFSRLTSPIVTCDVMAVGGTLASASYQARGTSVWNATLPGQRLYQNSGGNLVYRMSFAPQPGYVLTLVHNASVVQTGCGATGSIYLAVNCQGAIIVAGDWNWYSSSGPITDPNYITALSTGQYFSSPGAGFCTPALPPGFPAPGSGGSMGGMYPVYNAAPPGPYTAFQLFTTS